MKIKLCLTTFRRLRSRFTETSFGILLCCVCYSKFMLIRCVIKRRAAKSTSLRCWRRKESSAENRRLLSSTRAFHFNAPHHCNVCNSRMNLVEHYDGFFSTLPVPTVEIYESYKCLKLIWNFFSFMRPTVWVGCPRHKVHKNCRHCG